jgi:phytoene dehydrogenase-like protein
MIQSFSPLSYRRAALKDQYDAIVIGSGAGGLTAAVLLAKHAGKRALVLERHYTAGGFTQIFRRPGFEWDVGLHYIGQVQDPESETRRIFDHIADGRLQWARMPDIYDRLTGIRSLLRLLPDSGATMVFRRGRAALEFTRRLRSITSTERAIPSEEPAPSYLRWRQSS